MIINRKKRLIIEHRVGKNSFDRILLAGWTTAGVSAGNSVSGLTKFIPLVDREKRKHRWMRNTEAWPRITSRPSTDHGKMTDVIFIRVVVPLFSISHFSRINAVARFVTILIKFKQLRQTDRYVLSCDFILVENRLKCLFDQRLPNVRFRCTDIIELDNCSIYPLNVIWFKWACRFETRLL